MICGIFLTLKQMRGIVRSFILLKMYDLTHFELNTLIGIWLTLCYIFLLLIHIWLRLFPKNQIYIKLLIIFKLRIAHRPLDESMIDQSPDAGIGTQTLVRWAYGWHNFSYRLDNGWHMSLCFVFIMAFSEPKGEVATCTVLSLWVMDAGDSADKDHGPLILTEIN